MNKRISVSIALAITIIAMTITFSITWIVSMRTFENTVSAVTQRQAQYAKLAEIDNYVHSNFFGIIDDNLLFDRVALGYVNGLGDRYSAYYTEKEYTELVNVESGALTDIGVEIVREADARFRIVRVYDGSPAAKAGVEVNGYISLVDGEEAKTFTTLKALKSRLYGGDGTELALSVIYGVNEERVFSIRRGNFTAPVVELQILKDYAYVRISSFEKDPYAEFTYAVDEAVRQGVKGIVFDVRGTASGQFRNSYEAINYLCPVGTVAKSVGKSNTVRVLSTSDENAIDLPMAVVVDSGTAGPAELFAVSVRDLAGGQIVGTTTAGHGTIQSAPYRLQDGSAVSVTISNLLTGRDEDFNGKGIVPGVEIESNMAERVNSKTMEEYLYNPLPGADDQIKRGLEVARVMVVERGGEPGSYTFDEGAAVVVPPLVLAGEDNSDASASGVSESGDESVSASVSASSSRSGASSVASSSTSR